MKKKFLVFFDYLQANLNLLERFTVTKVVTGINHKDTGLFLELTRRIDNVVIGIDVVYDPERESGEAEFAISAEYVKEIIGDTNGKANI